jgi:hypothetical protein
MIKSISFENYKSFKDRVTIDIKPITVLVGPNSSGKSSIIKLLSLLHQSYTDGKRGALLNYVGPDIDSGGFVAISHRRLAKQMKIEIGCDLFSPDVSSYDYMLGEATISLEVSQKKEVLQFTGVRGSDDDKKLPLQRVEESGEWVQDIPRLLQSGDKMSLKFVIKEGHLYVKLPKDIYQKCIDDVLQWENILTVILSKGHSKNVSKADLTQLVHKMLRDYSHLANKNSGLKLSDALVIHAGKYQGSMLTYYPDLDGLNASQRKILSDIQELGQSPFMAKLRHGKMPEVKVFQRLLDELNDPTNSHVREKLATGALEYINLRCYEFCNELRAELQGTIMKYVKPTFEENIQGVQFFHSLRPLPKRYYTEDELKQFVFLNVPPSSFQEEELRRIEEGVNQNLYALDINYEIFIREMVDKDLATNLFSILVREKSSDIMQNYCDVGFGISQIIPILIRIEAKKTHLDYSLICIEQPELHLHPLVQSRLSSVFAKALYLDIIEPPLPTRMSFILETHSEHLIRGLQILIAKKKLSPSDVAIYYIGKDRDGNSNVKAMGIDEGGFFPEPWPEGFFDQAYLQSIELIAGKN